MSIKKITSEQLDLTATDIDAVAKTGDESISGIKTFTDNIIIGASATADGAFRKGAEPDGNKWFGIYDSDGGVIFGIAKWANAIANFVGLAGYYSGLAITGLTSATNAPIFGLLNSLQSGYGKGVTAFTVYDNNKVETFNNTLDDGSGSIDIAGSYKINGVDLSASDVGAEPANANIQSHISSTSNPHSVDKSDVGLGNVQNIHYGNIKSVTGDYTLLSTDNGAWINAYAAAGITITIPDTLLAGFHCTVAQTGAGQVTFVGDGDMDIKHPDGHIKTRTQDSMVGLFVRAANEVQLGGDTAE